jgi:hypothetical protein
MENNTFEILICAYGDHPVLIKRLMESLFKYSTLNHKIHVGLNVGSNDSKNYLRELLDSKKITTLIESNININKDPMMRLLMDLVEVPYMVWIDDDSYINKKGWDQHLQVKMLTNQADVLGFSHCVGRTNLYSKFLETQAWYKNIVRPNAPNTCYFPIGAFWAAKCEYLRKYDYPNKQMIKRNDDMLLGDLLHQTSGSFESIGGWDDIFMVNKEHRRGDGEHGWKNF